MSIPSGLILDLDDTILDYTSVGKAVWANTIPPFAWKISIPVHTLQEAIDASSHWYWSDPVRHREGRLSQQQARRIVVRSAFHRLGLDRMQLAEELADAFSTEREIQTRPLDGAIETLENLRSSGSRMVMLTNGEAALQRSKIERFSLARFFDAILIEGEIGYGKPAEQAFRAAMHLLGGCAEPLWMIGDDYLYDIAPAKRMGLKTVWIHDLPDAVQNPAADILAASLKELWGRWNRVEDP